MDGKFKRKFFIVILVTIGLGLTIPFRNTWGAPAFQTVPTMGPTPTRRATQTSVSPTQTTASENTPAPTRTRRPTSLPESTEAVNLPGVTPTSEPAQASGSTALPPSDTPVPAAPTSSLVPSTTNETSGQALQAASTPTETQPGPVSVQSASVTQIAELPEPDQAGTNWLPAIAVVLGLSAAGMWVLQRRRS